MIQENENICPRCGHHRMRLWSELDDDERDLTLRLLPELASKLGHLQVRVCVRCWYYREVGPETA